MTPRARLYISDAEVALFERIRAAVIALPDMDLGEDEEGKTIHLTCHVLARAVARVFRLRFFDGRFYPNYQHCWLLTSDGNIIDVYPIAVGSGPILFDRVSALSPAHYLYLKEMRGFYRGRFSKPKFRAAVKKVSGELRKTAMKQ